jgi:acyl-CoA reductase-like NAD-dependent aldehyde dehydrogenase
MRSFLHNRAVRPQPDYPLLWPAAPATGITKQSGWGREMGHEALHAYTEVKAVTTLL